MLSYHCVACISVNKVILGLMSRGQGTVMKDAHAVVERLFREFCLYELLRFLDNIAGRPSIEVYLNGMSFGVLL